MKSVDLALFALLAVPAAVAGPGGTAQTPQRPRGGLKPRSPRRTPRRRRNPSTRGSRSWTRRSASSSRKIGDRQGGRRREGEDRRPGRSPARTASRCARPTATSRSSCAATCSSTAASTDDEQTRGDRHLPAAPRAADLRGDGLQDLRLPDHARLRPGHDRRCRTPTSTARFNPASASARRQVQAAGRPGAPAVGHRHPVRRARAADQPGAQPRPRRPGRRRPRRRRVNYAVGRLQRRGRPRQRRRATPTTTRTWPAASSSSRSRPADGPLKNLGFGVGAARGPDGTLTATGLPGYRTPGQQTFFSYRSDATAAGTTIADGTPLPPRRRRRTATAARSACWPST